MAQDRLVIQRKIARLSAASTWPPSLTMAVAIVYSRGGRSWFSIFKTWAGFSRARLAGVSSARAWEGNRRREVMCWAMIGRGMGFALREDLPGAGDVVSESVRASQEEIWPLKGGGWVDGEFVRVAREGERAGRARHYCGSGWKVGRMIMDGRGMTTRCRERLERVY